MYNDNTIFHWDSLKINSSSGAYLQLEFYDEIAQFPVFFGFDESGSKLDFFYFDAFNIQFMSTHEVPTFKGSPGAICTINKHYWLVDEDGRILELIPMLQR